LQNILIIIANKPSKGTSPANRTLTLTNMGTISDFSDFDAQQDSEVLHKAMKGMGTDEAAIIEVIAHRSNKQRQELKAQYAQMWGKDLVKHLKDELGSNLEDAIVALMETPDAYDAHCLHKAIKGAGTDEHCLIEIMSSRSNEEIKKIKETYKKVHKKELVKCLQDDTSGSFKRLLFSLGQAARPDDDVDAANAEADAQSLYDAGAGQWGTDESRFNVIMASRSFEQLQEIFAAYERIADKTIEETIKNEMSTSIKQCMLAIAKCAQSKVTYFAESLYKSMKGAGTDDRTLIRIMVSRSEIDLNDIKVAFQALYGQSLEEFIHDDCSGDYKRLLIQVCRGNQD